MKDLKREYRREKKQKLEEQESTKKEQNDKSEILLSYERDYEKYLSIQKKIKPKGNARVSFINWSSVLLFLRISHDL